MTAFDFLENNGFGFSKELLARTFKTEDIIWNST